MMQAKLSSDVVGAVENDSIIELWPRRLGHTSEKRMTELMKWNVLSKINHVHLKNYADCLERKQNRVTFKSSLLPE